MDKFTLNCTEIQNFDEPSTRIEPESSNLKYKVLLNLQNLLNELLTPEEPNDTPPLLYQRERQTVPDVENDNDGLDKNLIPAQNSQRNVQVPAGDFGEVGYQVFDFCLNLF